MTRGLLFALLLYLGVSCSSSLFVHIIISNDHVDVDELESYYSTLGTPPQSLLSAGVVLIRRENVDEQECKLLKQVNGSIIVYYGKFLPSMKGCNNDDMGITSAFARVAQSMDARGVIIASTGTFSHGRVVGVTNSVTIPVVVAPKKVVRYIAEHVDSIASVTLTAISHQESKLIAQLRSVFLVWTKINAALFGLLSFVFGYTVYLDIKLLRNKKKSFSHYSFLKWMCLLSSVCSFLWHSIDPFSFDGFLWWHSCVLKSLTLGFCSMVTLLVLRIWISAPLRKMKYLRIWTIAIYTSVGVLFITAVAYGIWWDNTIAIQVHLWTHLASLVLGATGYIFFGRNLVVALANSGNVSKNKHVLPTKLAVFIVFYALVAYSLTIVAFLEPLGVAIGTLLVGLVTALIFFSIFAILFLPKMKRITKKIIRPSNGRIESVSSERLHAQA